MSAKLKNITFTMEYTEELDKSFRFLSQENSVLTTAKLQDSEGHIVTFESLQILDNLLAQDLVDNCKPGDLISLKMIFNPNGDQNPVGIIYGYECNEEKVVIKKLASTLKWLSYFASHGIVPKINNFYHLVGTGIAFPLILLGVGSALNPTFGILLAILYFANILRLIFKAITATWISNAENETKGFRSPGNSSAAVAAKAKYN